jgi:hypothetical protein
MIRAGCKQLIEAVGLDSTRYASHSCKRGAALTAMEAGLSHVQIQDLGRWANSSMVLMYAGGHDGQADRGQGSQDIERLLPCAGRLGMASSSVSEYYRTGWALSASA